MRCYPLPKDHLFSNKDCYAGLVNDPYSVLNPTRKAVVLVVTLY